MQKLPAEDAAAAEIEAARMRTAMASPQQMKDWLLESGRRYMVFDSFDLVDAIWTGNNPVGVQELQDVLSLYRHHRRRIPNGDYEEQEDPVTGQTVRLSLHKDEILEPDEADRVIRYLIGLITEPRSKQHIPGWTLDSPAR